MGLCARGLTSLMGGVLLASGLGTGALGQGGATPSGVVLPSGRRITPAGGWIATAPFPFALALRPDGGQMVVPSIGFPFALNVLERPELAERSGGRAQTRQIPASGKADAAVQVHAGVVYSPDGGLLYDATGDTGAVDVWSTADWRRVQRMELNGPTGGKEFQGSFAAVVALSPDGRWLYVLDQGNWRVVVMEAASGQRVATLATGSNPFGLCLSPDGRLYVTNSGLFEYSPISGVEAKDLVKTGLKFPASGYPSRQAREGGVVEGHAVAGLGSENSDRGSSLWSYDVTDPVSAGAATKLRLGARIAEQGKTIGGAAPTGVVAGSAAVYVALSHQDAVAVVSPDGTRLLAEVPLTPFTGKAFEDRRGEALRGVIPSGLAWHGDRLYVAESGLEAVAVVDTATNRVLGHIPVGWNPAALTTSADGRTLYVVNAKGKGTGPNGGKAFSRGRAYIGELEYGSVSVIPVAAGDDLAASTAMVVANNLAARAGSGPLPRLKHVFLVIRENRTFDEVFGDLPGADGEASMARYGMNGTMEENHAVQGAQVTPNAHALARRFATSDNFFADSDVSADGHRWAVGIAPTPWMNVAWASNYGGRRKGDVTSAAPGRRAFSGGADAPMPEDEPQFGSLWEHIAGNHLRLRNYGEGLEVEGGEEIAGAEPEGQRVVLNSPVPNPVFTSSDRVYPTFNLGIPDQVRYAEFRRDFSRLLAKGDAPALVVIRLPGDHTAEPRPLDGYPYRASYVADNDLALGKIMELISHSRIWKDSAVFVTEDDAQGGADHVDAHRSVLLVMSPWIRRGMVAHGHSSMMSIQKTMYALLGLGPLNLEDALAADLGEMFTATPDFAPYEAVASDLRVFDPAKAKVAKPKTAAEAHALLDCDDEREIAKEFKKKRQVDSR